MNIGEKVACGKLGSGSLRESCHSIIFCVDVKFRVHPLDPDASGHQAITITRHVIPDLIRDDIHFYFCICSAPTELIIYRVKSFCLFLHFIYLYAL